MPDLLPKAQVDLEDLTLHEGAPVLLRRALAKLGPGEMLEARGDSPELAEGLAPRGALIEAGGPEFAFTLRKKREVWARELTSIYRQAVGNQWSASRDIPWADLPELPAELVLVRGVVSRHY